MIVVTLNARLEHNSLDERRPPITIRDIDPSTSLDEYRHRVQPTKNGRDTRQRVAINSSRVGVAAIINPLFEHGDVAEGRRGEDVLRERGRIQYGGHGVNICLCNNGCDGFSRCLLLGVQAVRCEPVRAAGACGCTGYALLLVVRRTGCRGPSAFGGEVSEGLGRSQSRWRTRRAREAV